MLATIQVDKTPNPEGLFHCSPSHSLSRHCHSISHSDRSIQCTHSRSHNKQEDAETPTECDHESLTHGSVIVHVAETQHAVILRGKGKAFRKIGADVVTLPMHGHGAWTRRKDAYMYMHVTIHLLEKLDPHLDELFAKVLVNPRVAGPTESDQPSCPAKPPAYMYPIQHSIRPLLPYS